MRPNLQAANVPAVLAGDYNVVPTDADIYDMRSWKDNALVQPEPRALVRADERSRLDRRRCVHSIRTRPMYTFWSYLRKSWERDAGMRLDHLMLGRAITARLAAAGVDREVRGEPNASDHAPAWITLS